MTKIIDEINLGCYYSKRNDREMNISSLYFSEDMRKKWKQQEQNILNQMEKHWITEVPWLKDWSEEGQLF